LSGNEGESLTARSPGRAAKAATWAEVNPLQMHMSAHGIKSASPPLWIHPEPVLPGTPRLRRGKPYGEYPAVSQPPTRLVRCHDIWSEVVKSKRDSYLRDISLSPTQPSRPVSQDARRRELWGSRPTHAAASHPSRPREVKYGTQKTQNAAPTDPSVASSWRRRRPNVKHPQGPARW
jgi:hypothetical protein